MDVFDLFDLLLDLGSHGRRPSVRSVVGWLLVAAGLAVLVLTDRSTLPIAATLLVLGIVVLFGPEVVGWLLRRVV